MKACSGANGNTLSRSFLYVILLSLAFASAGVANIVNVSVNCQTGGSLNAAIAALNPADQNTVTLTGGCTENVVVSGFTYLVIQGPAVLNQPASGLALNIQNSSQILIQNVTFTGVAGGTNTSPLVSVSNSQSVGFTNCLFMESGGMGLQVISSGVGLNGGMVMQNAWQGIVVSGASSLGLNGWDVNSPVTVLDNGMAGANYDGIDVFQGGMLNMGPYVQVIGNSGNGITLAGASVSACCGSAVGTPNSTNTNPMSPGPVIAANKGWGIYAGNYSTVTLVGNNSGTPAVIISNNTQGGMVVDTSWAGLFYGVNVANNGFSTQTNPTGGIYVTENGALDIQGGTIEDNTGPGILASQGSAVTLCCGETITGNSESGMYIDVNASAYFPNGGGAANSIKGNTPTDLTCDAGGLAAADKGYDPGIGKKSCPNYFNVPPRKKAK